MNSYSHGSQAPPYKGTITGRIDKILFSQKRLELFPLHDSSPDTRILNPNSLMLFLFPSVPDYRANRIKGSTIPLSPPFALFSLRRQFRRFVSSPFFACFECQGAHRAVSGDCGVFPFSIFKVAVRANNFFMSFLSPGVEISDYPPFSHEVQG